MFNSTTMLALTIFVFMGININAIRKGRKGRTRLHTLAFVSGITGLCGLPLAIIASLPLALQFLTPVNGSPEAVTFFIIGAILILATLCSAVTGMMPQPRRNETPDLQ